MSGLCSHKREDGTFEKLVAFLINTRCFYIMEFQLIYRII
jgi:hypothetical protein